LSITDLLPAEEMLEKENRELTTLLELAYGKLALAGEKNTSAWGASTSE